MEILMDALTEKLGIKLQEWKPEISDRVRQYISEIIDLADRDLLQPRTVEQEVLNLCAPGGALLIDSIRNHDAFLNSYSSEDDGLYDDC
jgi:hypothetical protein